MPITAFIDTHDDQSAQPALFGSQAAVDTIGPDIGSRVLVQPFFCPVPVLLRPGLF